MLNEFLKERFQDLNKKFGTLTIQEMHKLSHELHIENVCNTLHITKSQYKKNIEDYEEMYYRNIYEG